MDEATFDRAKAFIRDLFEGDSGGHDYWHSIRVHDLAVSICGREGGKAQRCSNCKRLSIFLLIPLPVQAKCSIIELPYQSADKLCNSGKTPRKMCVL